MGRIDIEIATGGGTCRAGLFEARGGAGAAVILYMDAFGPRPGLHRMAERLAGMGYATLVPDLFWRFGTYGPFDPVNAFSDPEKGPALRRMLAETTQAMTITDTGAFLEALSARGLSGPVAAIGYCMGGARALNAAASWPERIVAAASFHGGNLANGAPDSPAANAARIQARIHVGVAGVDGSFPPEQSAVLARALREAGVDHTIENYVGMQHGWCVPDHRVFDEAGAERHWKRLAVLLEETMGG